MRVSRHCAICLFALTALASSVKFANADFFQSTNVNLGGWAYASDRYYDDLNALDYGIEVSDRFNNVSVNTATQDLKVTWWGSVETGTNLDEFAIRFYNPNGAVPDQGAFYAGGLTPTSATSLGTSGGRDFFRYEATIGAPSLNGANDYFVSIYAIGTQTDPGDDVANPFPGSGVGEPDPNAFQWLSANDALVGTEVFREFPLNATPWTSTGADPFGRAFNLETVAASPNRAACCV